MADNSKIEWTDATWNPITGCSVTSPGCTNCYAMRLAGTRMKHHPSRAGLTREVNGNHVWTGEVRFNDRWLDQPRRWARPRDIFVCAHGDLFHENVPDDWIDKCVGVMRYARQHRFQILTKRAARMRRYFEDLPQRERDWNCDSVLDFMEWPLPNVWLGVSVEDQARADERIPELLATPAAVRWISAEPLLGPVDLTRVWAKMPGGGQSLWNALRPPSAGLEPALDWVVAGGESGPGARPVHPDWIRALRDQCQAAGSGGAATGAKEGSAGVPFHFKQWGDWVPVPCDDEAAADCAYGEFHGGGDFIDSCLCAEGDPGAAMFRVGKARAGALLDGREWREMPGPDGVGETTEGERSHA